MNKKKKITRVLYILIGLIAVATLYFYFTSPEWKAFFYAGTGILLILNLVFAVFFIKRNFKG
ncbi:MAG: hypothetical protein GX857_03135 [Bacteroidales bacterium]|nr:hypothetical protein [Bacteroidales bacterium]